jgi:hypothetical protein
MYVCMYVCTDVESSVCTYTVSFSSPFRQSLPGMPDGIFSNQKLQFGYILESLRMETVGIFCAHLEFITAIWCILLSFGNFVVLWYFFPLFDICIVSRKIWQPRSLPGMVGMVCYICLNYSCPAGVPIIWPITSKLVSSTCWEFFPADLVLPTSWIR